MVNGFDHNFHSDFIMTSVCFNNDVHNSFLVYCRELAPGTVSLTGDRAQGDDSKHDSHYKKMMFNSI